MPKEANSAASGADEVLRELAAHRWALLVENVIVNARTVQLWGVVTSVEPARAICVAAENVPGVEGVEDHKGYPVVIPAM